MGRPRKLEMQRQCQHPGCDVVFTTTRQVDKYCLLHRTQKFVSQRREMNRPPKAETPKRSIPCEQCGDMFLPGVGSRHKVCPPCRASTDKNLYPKALYEAGSKAARLGFIMASEGRPADDAYEIACDHFGKPSRFFANEILRGHDLGVQIAGMCGGQKRMAWLLTHSDAMMDHASRTTPELTQQTRSPEPCVSCKWIPVCADTGAACQSFRHWVNHGYARHDQEQFPDAIYDPSDHGLPCDADSGDSVEEAPHPGEGVPRDPGAEVSV